MNIFLNDEFFRDLHFGETAILQHQHTISFCILMSQVHEIRKKKTKQKIHLSFSCLGLGLIQILKLLLLLLFINREF